MLTVSTARADCAATVYYNLQPACEGVAKSVSTNDSLLGLFRHTISGKLLAFGLVATMRLLSNYFDLLLKSWDILKSAMKYGNSLK